MHLGLVDSLGSIEVKEFCSRIIAWIFCWFQSSKNGCLSKNLGIYFQVMFPIFHPCHRPRSQHIDAMNAQDKDRKAQKNQTNANKNPWSAHCGLFGVILGIPKSKPPQPESFVFREVSPQELAVCFGGPGKWGFWSGHVAVSFEPFRTPCLDCTSRKKIKETSRW